MTTALAIWKEKVEVGENKLDLRGPAQILHFGVDPQGDLCVWFLADPKLPPKVGYLKKYVYVVGTGFTIDTAGKRYLGSVTDGAYVWHAFVPL